MVNVVSIGAIGVIDIFRLGPSDETLDKKIHELSCPYLDLRRIVERSRV